VFYEKYFNSECLCLPGSQFSTLETRATPTVIFSANSILQQNMLESTQSGSIEFAKVSGLTDSPTSKVNVSVVTSENASVVTSETCLLL